MSDVGTPSASAQKVRDLRRHFVEVFESPAGKIILQHLDEYSHQNFPNYDNANATYAKAGQQQLVSYIRGVLKITKEAD